METKQQQQNNNKMIHSRKVLNHEFSEHWGTSESERESERATEENKQHTTTCNV